MESEWIKVEDRLPNRGGEHLCRIKCGLYIGHEVAEFMESYKKFSFLADDNIVNHNMVTHWMPLPNPPTE